MPRTKKTTTAKLPRKDRNLLRAAQKGELKKLQSLVRKGANMLCADEAGMTASLHAAQAGHFHVIEWLLKNGASMTEKNAQGETALSLATRHRHAACAAWLGHLQFEYSEKLINSAKSGALEDVKRLVKQGASVDAKHNRGYSPLCYAAQNGHTAVVQWLFINGAPLDEKEIVLGETALIKAAKCGHQRVIQYLVENGASLSEKDKYGNNALLLAVQQGKLEAVQCLLKHGASLSVRDERGLTVLLFAVQYGGLGLVQCLLKHGASLSERDNDGKTALLLAVNARKLELVQWLLKHGASISERDNDGNTALLLVAREGKLQTMQCLLKHGASLSERDKVGNTALLLAAREGKLETVQWLLKNGASSNEKNNTGTTALTFARQKGHSAIVTYLKQRSEQQAEKVLEQQVKKIRELPTHELGKREIKESLRNLKIEKITKQSRIKAIERERAAHKKEIERLQKRCDWADDNRQFPSYTKKPLQVKIGFLKTSLQTIAAEEAQLNTAIGKIELRIEEFEEGLTGQTQEARSQSQAPRPRQEVTQQADSSQTQLELMKVQLELERLKVKQLELAQAKQPRVQSSPVGLFASPSKTGYAQHRLGAIATALYPYNANREGELSFCKGDKLRVVKQKTGKHWWTCELNGRTGLAPSNYLKLKHVTDDVPLPPLPQSRNSAQPILLRALYDHTTQAREQLSFKKGEQLSLIEKTRAGWWKCRLGDKEGFVPESYVEIIQRNTNVLGK